MRFVCDAMLAKLGRWLRMIGCDTIIAGERLADAEVLDVARQQGRILLTRDRRFLKNPLAYYVRSRELDGQLADVVSHFELEVAFPEKTLCPMCGCTLKKVSRERIKGKIPERVRSDTYWLCSGCEKIYWKGGHWGRINSLLRSLGAKK